MTNAVHETAARVAESYEPQHELNTAIAKQVAKNIAKSIRDLKEEESGKISKLPLKIKYVTSDDLLWESEDEAAHHEQNLFVMSIAAKFQVPFDVAAFIYDSDLLVSEPDLDQDGYWSILSADKSRADEYGRPEMRKRLGIVNGTFRDALSYAVKLPEFRLRERVGLVQSEEVVKV